MNLTHEYSLGRVVSSFAQAYSLCFGIFLGSLMSQFLGNWVIVKGNFLGKVEVVFHMDVGDDCVYEMDKDMEVVSSSVEMGKGLEVGNGMLVEGKHRWNGGNRYMVGVEDSYRIVIHDVGNHGDSFEHTLASFQMIFNKNFLHKA